MHLIVDYRGTTGGRGTVKSLLQTIRLPTPFALFSTSDEVAQCVAQDVRSALHIGVNEFSIVMHGIDVALDNLRESRIAHHVFLACSESAGQVQASLIVFQPHRNLSDGGVDVTSHLFPSGDVSLRDARSLDALMVAATASRSFRTVAVDATLQLQLRLHRRERSPDTFHPFGVGATAAECVVSLWWGRPPHAAALLSSPRTAVTVLTVRCAAAVCVGLCMMGFHPQAERERLEQRRLELRAALREAMALRPPTWTGLSAAELCMALGKEEHAARGRVSANEWAARRHMAYELTLRRMRLEGGQWNLCDPHTANVAGAERKSAYWSNDGGVLLTRLVRAKRDTALQELERLRRLMAAARFAAERRQEENTAEENALRGRLAQMNLERMNISQQRVLQHRRAEKMEREECEEEVVLQNTLQVLQECLQGVSMSLSGISESQSLSNSESKDNAYATCDSSYEEAGWITVTRGLLLCEDCAQAEVEVLLDSAAQLRQAHEDLGRRQKQAEDTLDALAEQKSMLKRHISSYDNIA